MAFHASKRKLPPRELKPFKEKFSKTAERVLDDKTVEVLLRFLNAGVIKSLDYPIAQGKEAMVFRATWVDRDSGEKGFRAVKVFKYETSSFSKSMMDYLWGDPRFNARGSRREIVKVWARKEFANLRLCFDAGVRVPEPIAWKENVLVMEFLGEQGIPSPLLEHAVLSDPQKVLEMLLEDVRKMLRAGLVHADLSSFNVIMHKGEPYIIDLGQAVLLEHPKARELLERDVHNLVNFFAKRGATKSFQEALSFVES
ncbi:MAG: serine protein kinase RIO [Candidatus Micrarchaeia archaeon]